MMFSRFFQINSLSQKLMMPLAVGALLSVSAVAFADDSPLVADAVLAEQEAVAPTDVKKQGWIPRLKVGASLAVASSNNVVGQIDGVSLTVGAQLDAGMDYRSGFHEWRNSLKIVEAFTQTPAIDQFIKSNDLLSLQSIYLYHLPSVPWIGPYFQLSWDTAMLPGYAAQDAGSVYSITPVDGSPTRTFTGRFLKLSDPFLPSTIKETAGFFAQPVDKPDMKLELRAGFGGRHTFANDQLTLSDDDTTAAIEVIELETIHQAGPAIAARLDGKLHEDKVTYFVAGEVMVPLLRSPDRAGDSGFDLTNILLEGGLSVKLFSWASLDYELRALREAQLIRTFQVQNSLLVTFGWDFFGGESA